MTRENLLEGERHNLYLLPSTEPLMKIKSMRVRCADLMACMRVKNAYTIVVVKPDGKVSVGGRILVFFLEE